MSLQIIKADLSTFYDPKILDLAEKLYPELLSC